MNKRIIYIGVMAVLLIVATFILTKVVVTRQVESKIEAELRTAIEGTAAPTKNEEDEETRVWLERLRNAPKPKSTFQD